jgi:transaldolase
MTENSLEQNQSNLTETNVAETVVAEPPKEQPKLTKQQLGQLRRQYITVTHGVVKACSHAAKFSATKPPGNNCIECWRAYFATSVDLEALHKTLTEGGVKKFIATHGIKYVRMFRGFLAQALMPEAKGVPEGGV